MNTNFITFTCLPILLVLSGCGHAEEKAAPDPVLPQSPVHVASISTRNLQPHGINSHVGDLDRSNLELNYRSYVEIKPDLLGASQVTYPRVKQLSDGRYILFYQDGHIGWNIYYSQSNDGKVWSRGRELFSSYRVENNTDDRCFATCDALILQNGDILAVSSFRTNMGFYTNLAGNGIMMRRSRDNGRTWDAEQIVYQGSNWEPYLLQLPDGKIQLYFTDANTATWSSGTSLIESQDNGQTWSPALGSAPYKIIRQITKYEGGEPVYTDQMPCAILLNDGHTLAAVLESCLADGSYWITMAYAEDDWVHLSGTEEGPADRQSNLFVGAGGYLVQFPSGETAVSYNDSESLLSIRMGDEQARNLREPYRPFKGYGYWGTMEVTGGHTVMASMHASMASSQNMIMVGECVLNHGVEAPLQSIRVDGDNSDWDGVDQALFIGSNSPVQGLFRFSHDRDHVYVCVDLLDESVSASDYVVLELDRLSSSERPSENALRVRLNSRNARTVSRFSDGAWTESADLSLESACRQSDEQATAPEDRGCIWELSIPKAVLGLSDGDRLLFHATLSDAQYGMDTFSNTSDVAADTWLPVTLK